MWAGGTNGTIKYIFYILGATRPPSTTTTTTTTSTTTQVPVESSTVTPILPGSNETLAHTHHDNLNGTEEHGGDLNHQHNSLPGFANSSLESDKLSSHGHSDAQSITLLSSTILIIGLTLGTFVI